MKEERELWYSGLGALLMFSVVVLSVILGMFGFLFSLNFTLISLLSFSFWLFRRKGPIYFGLMIVGWIILIGLFPEIPYLMMLVVPLLFTKWGEKYWGIWNERLRKLYNRFEVKEYWDIIYFILVLMWEVSVFRYGLFSWITWGTLDLLGLAVIFGIKVKKVKKHV